MKFNFSYFILAFAIGILFVYICTPFSEIVVRYPRPNDYYNLRYKLPNGIYLEYTLKEISCNSKTKTKTIGQQEEKDTRLLQG